MTGAPSQVPLPLEFRPARGRADFLVAPCNRAAVAWLDRWPDWPHHGLALYGPAGSGKSHLAHVFGARTGARFLSAAELGGADPAALAGQGRAVVIDSLDEGGPFDEATLLHLFNLVGETGGFLLLVARAAPARLPIALADLRSRLAALPAVAVGAPDDVLLGRLLLKHFQDRGLRVAEEVVRYLVQRMERSFEAALALAERLDELALAESRAVTVPLAKRALAEHEGAGGASD